MATSLISSAILSDRVNRGKSSDDIGTWCTYSQHMYVPETEMANGSM